MMDDDKGLAQLDDQIAALEDHAGGAQAMTEAFNRALARMQATIADTGREVSVLERGISRGLRGAIDGLVFDGASLAKTLQGLGKSMVDAAYNAAMRPVTGHFGQILAGGVESVIQSAPPFANGASFSQGRVMPFANGGVVSGPINFPMRGGMGLMGEAGPEAIMPLARGADGKLGVRTQGAAARPVNITMHITTPDVDGFRRSQSQISAQLGRALARGHRNH